MPDPTQTARAIAERLLHWLDTVPVQHQPWLSSEGAGLIREAADALSRVAEGSEQPCPNCGSEDRDHRGILRCRCPDRVPAPPAAPEIQPQRAEQFRQLPRYSITGRYGGSYRCEASATGEWVRWSDVQQLVDLVAPEAEGRTTERKMKPWHTGMSKIVRVRCDNCDGTGKVHSHNPECWICDGSGWLVPQKESQ